jgi:predicted alpha/beta hydrolase
MKPESITLNCADGYPLAAKYFSANPTRAVVVVAPALGVPTRFYAAYASYLAGRGFSVLTFDYRGSGDSANGPRRGRDMRMEDWGRLDIDAALAWARQEYKSKKLFLVGHSAGAQLPGLAPGSEALDGMILVAGSAPHLRHYPVKSWPMLCLTWHVLGPLLSWRRDDFPARQTGLGSTRVAAGVVRQWARWARTRDYLFDQKHGIDTSRYARLALPVLSYCFADDSYATPAATDALLAHYPVARVDRRVVPRLAQGTIGHFGFFRESSADSLWRESAGWLEARA